MSTRAGTAARGHFVRFAASHIIEGLAWGAGFVCLGAWALGGLMSVVGKQMAMQRFAAASTALPAGADTPDQSLWAKERIEAWRASFAREAPPPLGVLRIPRIGLEVPILEGIDSWTLNRAVGHIEGTALPGSDGNAGIAGHRDGFFRGLKDVRPGDVLELETLAGIEAYRIERAWVVEPSEVSVLEPTPERAVTLVTCYPFYFMGPAPRRFIVRAVLEPANPQDSAPMGPRSN